MKVKKGDIVYLNKQIDLGGHIYTKNRPFVVISNDTGNYHSTICMITPLTHQHKNLSQGTHCVISYDDSMVCCEQIFTVSQDLVENIVGNLNGYDFMKVNLCLKIAFDLEGR